MASQLCKQNVLIYYQLKSQHLRKQVFNADNVALEVPSFLVTPANKISSYNTPFWFKQVSLFSSLVFLSNALNPTHGG